MSASVDLKEFLTGFLVESEEYLATANRNLVAVSEALREQRAEPKGVRELFRALHTIKGLSSMVGAEPIVAISHEMEGLLRLADRAGGVISEPSLDLLVKGTRAISERMQSISKNGLTGLAAAPTSLIAALVSAQTYGLEKPKVGANVQLPDSLASALSLSEREQLRQAAANSKRVVVLNFQPSPERVAAGVNITSVRSELAKIGELVKVLPRSAPGSPTGIQFTLILISEAEFQVLAKIIGDEEASISELAITVPSTPPETRPQDLVADDDTEWAPTDLNSIRVDIRRLDDVMERLSDLVVTRAKLVRAAGLLTASGVDTRDLMAIIGEDSRQLKRLRGAITKSRMVPLTELFQRLPLVVRGLTQGSKKSVDLKLQVGAAEVDKAVADKIFPAIVHLIRNAVDHAIEERHIRAQAGKSETGTLTLMVKETSGTGLVLVLSDDGAGIDRAAVARKAQRPLAQNDDELLHQITLPGLSTRDEVSTTSGRGMGMDIVKKTVELLGGRLALKTQASQGTTFSLQIPISITIVDVLSFISGGEIFAAPIAAVEEIIEVDAKLLAKLPTGADQKFTTSLLQRRGVTIPYLVLDSALNQRPTSPPPYALIVQQTNGSMMAFGVDKMLGQQEAVVRPLDDQLVRVDGLSGATDLGDGRPTLVLDLAILGAVSRPLVH